ncbi:MAG TPA: DeoR/GlpR transcriptional regulator, partial [Desulfobulbaceae bacterium]|nr:DeoR/GlpR transcriptional regulator [Desulfobulbaceae bacterium]
AQIRSFRAHHAILTVSAIDEQTGIMDFNIHEAQIARAMIKQAKSVTVLADSSKFGRIASFEVCEMKRITNLVCERRPPEKIEQRILDAGVTLISVEK